MERSTVLDCTAPCHLAWGGGVGGQLTAYFLLSLAVPSCSCSDRINEFSGIRTRNRAAANCKTLTASQVHNMATVGSPAVVYTAVIGCLAFGLWNSVPKSILSHIG